MATGSKVQPIGMIAAYISVDKIGQIVSCNIIYGISLQHY
jgi:hypothetical protein